MAREYGDDRFCEFLQLIVVCFALVFRLDARPIERTQYLQIAYLSKGVLNHVSV